MGYDWIEQIGFEQLKLLENILGFLINFDFVNIYPV